MKHHALITVKTGWYNEYSPVGRNLKMYKNKVTVKKRPDGLWWETGKTYIPVRYIDEVLEGDITEYLL